MDMEIWKSTLSILVKDFQKELTLEKESKSLDNSKMYDLLKKIMIHYFGEERLEQIWDGHCLSLMSPLTACEIEFNDYFMRISRRTKEVDLEIKLGNNNLPNFSSGSFSREHYYVVSENENDNRNFYGDIIVDYTNKGDVVCRHYDKRIEPGKEPQEVSWTIAQLSRVKENDFQQNDSIWISKLKTHGVSKAVNLGIGVKKHFSLSDDVQLYMFDYKVNSLAKENNIDLESNKKL